MRRRLPRSGTLAVAVAVLAACGSPPSRHSLLGDPSPVGGVVGSVTTGAIASSAPTTALAAPTTAAPTTTTAAPDVHPGRPYAIGTTSLDLTDASRNTGSKPGRHLPTLVFYPAVGTNPNAETNGAPGLSHSWPLLVFAHGYNVTPLTYHDLIHHLAESGYVVAAPSFPLETQGGPLDENDLSNEPADMRYVITQVIAASQGPGVLTGMIDGAKVGAVGHSDGGEAVLALGFLSGQSDNRVGPIVAMAAQAILNGDHVAPAPVRHPLLVVHGTADSIVAFQKGEQVYTSAPSPKAFLRLLGAGHLPPIADANQWRPVVEATVVDWLDAWFGGPNSVGVAGRLGHDANVSGTSSIQLG